MKSSIAVAALLVAAYANAGRAAPLTVVIEKLNPAAKACGISEPQLETVALRTLEKSRFQPDPDAGGTLNVHVTGTGTRRNVCGARISVQMQAVKKPLPSAGTAKPKLRSRVPVVVLCDKSSQYSASKASFPVAIESVVEYSIRQCLGSLKY